jgi:hypothetical protein
MTDLFLNRSATLSDPARDIMPVTPSDSTDLGAVAVALYVETGGVLSIDTVFGDTRTVTVADFSILPVGVRRVRASGTSASGIHALVAGQ